MDKISALIQLKPFLPKDSDIRYHYVRKQYYIGIVAKETSPTYRAIHEKIFGKRNIYYLTDKDAEQRLLKRLNYLLGIKNKSGENNETKLRENLE